MGRRRGELTAAAIDRGWPHQVAIPADECRGSPGRFMDAFRLDLSVCERGDDLRERNIAPLKFDGHETDLPCSPRPPLFQ
jgi:hypothetical protein